MRNCFLLALLLMGLQGPAQLQRFSFTASKMGSPFTIILYAADSTSAGRLAKESFALTDSLVNIFSDYIDSSELNRLCARAGNKSFTCSPALFDILQQAAHAYAKSKGSFDITLGPVTRLWRKARKNNRFPAANLVKEKLALTGFTKITMDTATREVRLQLTGMQIDLGGIGQGYIAQQVINRLQQEQVENALVDASGDIVCMGKPPGTRGWTVAINIPESEEALLPRHLLISNQAVTTSGDVYQYLEHNGKRYSHIIDPATGYGITSQKNVTVIAADGTTADWLTKACSILSIPQAKKLAASLHAGVLITQMKKGKLISHASKTFKKMWKNTNVER